MEDDELSVFNVDINASLYNTDLDDVGFEPEEVPDDSDSDYADIFGY